MIYTYPRAKHEHDKAIQLGFTNSWTSADGWTADEYLFGGNLEITNDGKFLITSSGSNLLWHTVGGGWSSVSLPGAASALGDYEHSTEIYADSRH